MDLIIKKMKVVILMKLGKIKKKFIHKIKEVVKILAIKMKQIRTKIIKVKIILLKMKKKRKKKKKYYLLNLYY